MLNKLAISPHIPLLRRFARLLAGSQTLGDIYTAALLESIIADAARYEDTSNVKLTLYQHFFKFWSSMPGNGADSKQAGLDGNSLEFGAKEAYLLTTIEDFSTPQIAEIIGCDVETAKRLIAEAESAALNNRSVNVLIIEDEPIIAMDLEDVLASLGHNSIGVARSVQQALTMAKDKGFELILSDVQLADGSSGIDAVESILQSKDVPVIFITAYPEKLLTGERPEPIYLVTKPFKPDEIKAVIGQALQFRAQAKAAA